MIVANDISRKDIGFDSEDNEVTIFFADGKRIKLEKMNKKLLSENIIKIIAGLKD